jgi:hypothetical protein
MNYEHLPKHQQEALEQVERDFEITWKRILRAVAVVLATLILSHLCRGEL